MNLLEAAKAALEALEEVEASGKEPGWSWADDVIPNLRSAIEETEIKNEPDKSSKSRS